MSQPTVFISYSHKDEKEKEAMLSHLGVLRDAGLIDLWSDDRIGAGEYLEEEINKAIARAKVAILLISANFLTSDFILSKEVPALLKKRDVRRLTVFPVIAKACAWKTVDWLVKMNVRPKNGKPVWDDSGHYADDDLAKIAGEVATILNEGGNFSGEESCKEGRGRCTAETSPTKVDQPESEQYLHELLAQHQKNRHELLKQKAVYAAGEVPLRLLNQIRAEEEEISKIKQQLGE